MGSDLRLSSPGCGELYYLDGPADEDERAWRVLEAEEGGEGLDSDEDPDLLYPDDGYSWADSMDVRAGSGGSAPFRWLGG
jgi:hypothetical protein